MVASFGHGSSFGPVWLRKRASRLSSTLRETILVRFLRREVRLLDRVMGLRYNEGKGGRTMVQCVRGRVQGDVIVLEDGVRLPDGAAVEVRVLTEPAVNRDEAFRAVLAHRETMRGVQIDVVELLREDRQEREEHWDQVLFRDP
jgi:hypothetical protein